jgi:DNA excision repair protein ERCC-2
VDLDRLVVIVDEAHNLPHQVTELDQPVLSSKDLDFAIKEAKYHKSDSYIQFFEVLQDVMRDSYNGSEKEDGLVELDKLEFLKLIEMRLKDHNLKFNKTFIDEMAKIGRKYSKRSAKRMISSNYERMAEFLYTMIDAFKFNSVMFILEEKSSIRLRLIELDPVIKIRPVLKKTHKSLLMSGSLPDISIFEKQIGLKNYQYIHMNAEYTSKNVMVKVVRDLSSQYSRRTDKMIETMSDVITEVINTNMVNTLIFSTSYKFSKILYDLYSRRTDRILMGTNRGMNAIETDKLVHEFKQAAGNGTAVLSTIQGGRINEGTDFPGNTAQIIILSGIAFPPFDLIMKRRVGYNKRYSDNPLESVYFSKAIQQLIQSIGRGVRSLEDKVYTIIMDDRLLQEKYSKLLPDYLKLNMMEIVNNTRAIALQGK